MTAPIYNSSYGTGIEGVVNYANSVVDWWMVPFFLTFIVFALTITLSKDRQFPISAVLAFSTFIGFIAASIFKMMTIVNEAVIYIALVIIAFTIGWGIWQSK